MPFSYPPGNFLLSFKTQTKNFHLWEGLSDCPKGDNTSSSDIPIHPVPVVILSHRQDLSLLYCSNNFLYLPRESLPWVFYIIFKKYRIMRKISFSFILHTRKVRPREGKITLYSEAELELESRSLDNQPSVLSQNMGGKTRKDMPFVVCLFYARHYASNKHACSSITTAL